MSKARSAYSISNKKEKFDTHIIVVWVDNEAGVLARIAGLFSGRGYNIDSLAVAEVDKKKNIFVMCHTGTRSQAVCKWLKAQGYNHCVNVLGGIDAWAALIDRNIRRY